MLVNLHGNVTLKVKNLMNSIWCVVDGDKRHHKFRSWSTRKSPFGNRDDVKERESQRHKINKRFQKITHFLEFTSSMAASMFWCLNVIIPQNFRRVFLTKITWMSIRFGLHLFKCEKRLMNGGSKWNRSSRV
jgi:hypothetical protein